MIIKLIRLAATAQKMLKHFFESKLNFLTFKLKNVKYATMPTVKGRISIVNHGTISIGNMTKFNCSQNSNYVGLFKTCTIAVTKNASLEIGDHSGFSGLSLYCSRKIKIGDYVNCGGNVCIWDTDFHPLDYLDRRSNSNDKTKSAEIIIEDDVFIGANSIILKGVTIGARSIVGAGSVVARNIPSDEIWGGNPIKFIRKINET